MPRPDRIILILREELKRNLDSKTVNSIADADVPLAFHDKVMRKQGDRIHAYANSVGTAICLANYYKEEPELSVYPLRTEKALYDAFRELAAERPLKEITVKALTDRAEINRKTFYIHYHDIEGFIAGLQQRFISEVAIYMGNVLEERNAETAFRKTLCYLAADPEWYHLILSTSDYGQIWAVLEDPDTRPWDFESFLPETEHAPEIVRYLMGLYVTYSAYGMSQE